MSKITVAKQLSLQRRIRLLEVATLGDSKTKEETLGKTS